MRQSIILMIMTIVSKIFGLLREISLSYVYGTSAVADAFLVSFFIPSILINGITLGIATGFIPIYSRIKSLKDREAADYFTNNLLNAVFIIFFILTIFTFYFLEEIMNIVAIGLEGEIFDLAVFFGRMVSTSIFIAAVGGVFRGYLQIYGHFSITVINAALMNIVIILSIIISGSRSIKILGIGTAIGLSLQYLIFLFPIKKLGFKYKPVLDFKNESLKEVQKLSIPVLIGVLVNEVNIIVDKAIASTLQVGAISALNYSSGIQEFVVGVVILSIITVVYPLMSEFSGKKQYQQLKDLYNRTVYMNLFLVIPATIGLMVFSKEITALLFYRGAFDEMSLAITQKSLFFYALGVTGISLNTIGQRIFYSLKKIKEPLIISIFSVALNILLNICFAKYFGLIGLALATSIAMTVSGMITIYVLKRKNISLKRNYLIKSTGKILLNSLIIILAARFLYGIFPNNIFLVILIIVSIISYIYLSLKTDVIEKRDIDAILKRNKNKF